MILNAKPCALGMLRPRQFIDIFRTQFFPFFFHFRTTRRVVVREVVDREVVNREVVEAGRWRSKSHWCWDNIKCFLIACLVLFHV